MRDVTDADLLLLGSRGDEDALAALVLRYAPLVHSIAMSSCGRTDVAEDLAQEAFCRAIEHINEIRDPNSFRSWLWGITKRVCIDWARGAERRNQMGRLPETGPPSPNDPFSDVERAERRRQVRMAVDELPEKYRIVVQLRHLQGMSYEETADLLGLSPSGVSNRLAAAREMLRVKLKPLVAP